MGNITELATRPKARAKKAPPPKRWRNRWLHEKGAVFDSGFHVKQGERLGPSVFPSREIAEERAAEWLRECPDVVEICGVIYLGAVPDPNA